MHFFLKKLLWCLESGNNQKLLLEYEKYQELQMKSQRMQEEYEKQIHEMEENKSQALEELTEYYEAKLLEKVTLLEEVWLFFFFLKQLKQVQHTF